jgi:hypothetical protein
MWEFFFGQVYGLDLIFFGATPPRNLGFDEQRLLLQEDCRFQPQTIWQMYTSIGLGHPHQIPQVSAAGAIGECDIHENETGHTEPKVPSDRTIRASDPLLYTPTLVLIMGCI